MSDSQEQKIKFIPDTEANEDAFGVHTQTAKALSEILASNIKNTIRTIGLLGDWGSGKSTVIKYTHGILEKEKPGKFFFFTFDAWLHQGDAPRRSFLESLIDEGCKNNLLKKEKYVELKEKIQGRHENHEIKTTPIFTIWGVLIAFSLLFIPLAARMYDYKYSLLSHENMLPLALTSLPVLIALCNYVFWRDLKLLVGINSRIIWFALGAIVLGSLYVLSKYIPLELSQENLSLISVGCASGSGVFVLLGIFEFCKYNREFCLTHREKYKDRSIAELFINKSTSRVTNRIVKTPDPTSIEFSSLFHDVINDFCLCSRIVVIIFDNLDRVEKNVGLNMWAMIRSLLTNKAEQSNDIYVEPYVIIPLDKTSIDLLYDADSNICSERSSSFADKTFDVVLKLSPPIFSDWEEYLQKQLTYSFGDAVSARESAAINKFFRFSNEQKDHYLSKVTPRKLNSVLNRSAAKCLLWGNVIPICTIFYYILFEEELGENLEKVKSAPLQQLLLENDSAWLESLASLHYGVPRAKAMQIYIGPQILEAIQGGDVQKFIGLSNIPGFVTVLERVIEKNETTKGDVRTILNFTVFMKRLTLSASDICRIQSIVPILYDLFTRAEKWSYDEVSLHGLRIFLDDGVGTIGQILERMELSINESVKNWVSCFACFVGLLTDKEIEQVKKDLYVPGNEGQFIEILSEILKIDTVYSNKGLLQWFTPKADRDAIAQGYLEFSEKKSLFNHDSILVLQLLRDIKQPKKIPLLTVFEKIRAILYQPPSGEGQSLEWALSAFLNLGFTNIAKSRELFSDGRVFDLYFNLNNTNIKRKEFLKFYIVLLTMMFCPNLSSTMFNNSQHGISLISQNWNDDEFVNNFVKFIHVEMSESCHLEVFNLLIESVKDIKDWNKIMTALISYKLHNNHNLGDIYQSLITDNLHVIFNYIVDDITLNLFVKFIGQKDYFYERILKIKSDDTAFKVFELLDSTEYSPKSIAAFFEYISGRDGNWWETAFAHVSESYYPINKLAAAQPSLHEKELGESFFQSFEKYLDLFKGDGLVKLPKEVRNWSNLLLYVNQDKRTIFLNNAYDVIYSSTEANANSLLVLYFKQISELSFDNKEGDKLARRLLGIIKSNQIAINDFCLVYEPKIYKKLIDSAAEATRNEIRKVLSNYYTELPSDHEKESLAVVFQALEFSLPSKKKRKLEEGDNEAAPR